MITAIDARGQGGLEIAKPQQVRRLTDYAYKVRSQSGNGKYEVLKTELGWICSCPDHVYRGVKCKHIWAVEFSLALRREVEVRRIRPLSNISSCIYCDSENIVKDGVRHNKHGDVQKFCYKDCGRYFSFNIGFEKMKHNPQAITTTMQLYFSGKPLRDTQRSLRLLGVNVSHQTVYNWIKKYVALMQKYVERLKPDISDIWRADELWVKIKGNVKYVFALMDDETRYWIAKKWLTLNTRVMLGGFSNRVKNLWERNLKP